MIELGTLVRYTFDGDIGIVVKVHGGLYDVKWSDGSFGEHVITDLKVLS